MDIYPRFIAVLICSCIVMTICRFHHGTICPMTKAQITECTQFFQMFHHKGHICRTVFHMIDNTCHFRTSDVTVGAKCAVRITADSAILCCACNSAIIPHVLRYIRETASCAIGIAADNALACQSHNSFCIPLVCRNVCKRFCITVFI